MLSLIVSKSKYKEQTLLKNGLIILLELIISSVEIPVSMHLMYLMKKNVTMTKQCKKYLGIKIWKVNFYVLALKGLFFPVFPLHNRLQEVGIPTILAPISINNQFFLQKTLGCPKYFFTVFTELIIQGFIYM